MHSKQSGNQVTVYSRPAFTSSSHFYSKRKYRRRESTCFVHMAGMHVIQVAQLWQSDCASSAIFRAWITFRLNFRLKVTFCANIYRPLDREMVMLQLCCWKFSHEKLCSRSYSIEIYFCSKKGKIAF